MYCYLRHIFSLSPHFIFFVKVSLFSSCRIDLPYKSFFRFHCLKALLSPPLLDCQLNLFVKRSLNLDGYLFSCAWKSLSISFALSSFASTFIFCFAWKILSTGRSSYVIRRQQRVLPLTVPPESPIFFLCVKISLCSRFFPFIYYRFIVAASIYIILFSVQFSFYFFVKTTLILYLTSNFFPCVKITLFSSSFFLIRRIFITLQRYYFCALYFSFSLWKILSVHCCVLLIYGTVAFLAVLFSACVKFSRNKLRSSALSFIF